MTKRKMANAATVATVEFQQKLDRYARPEPKAGAVWTAGEARRDLNERDGQTHDFSRKEGVEHSEIVTPAGGSADWARDRSALWNAAERAERRSDARVAREFEIALPHELTAEQRLELTRDFAQTLADRHGAAVDFAIHAPHGATGATRAGDVRNHHAHLLMTRPVMEQRDDLDDRRSERETREGAECEELPSTAAERMEAFHKGWDDRAQAGPQDRESVPDRETVPDERVGQSRDGADRPEDGRHSAERGGADDRPFSPAEKLELRTGEGDQGERPAPEEREESSERMPIQERLKELREREAVPIERDHDRERERDGHERERGGYER